MFSLLFGLQVIVYELYSNSTGMFSIIDLYQYKDIYRQVVEYGPYSHTPYY